MAKILIVDDDSEIRENLSELLRAAGYETAAAATGEEAVRMVTQDFFDVILLDFIMPGMNGLEALGAMKKASVRSKFIMITAFATVDNAVEAIKKGASEYISKPFRIDDLMVLIRRTLEEVKFESSIRLLDMDDTLGALSNSIRRIIIHLLNVNKSMRLMDITRELEAGDHTKVLFHLRILKGAGIIDQNLEKAYVLTREGERIVECLHLLKEYLTAENKAKQVGGSAQSSTIE